MKILWLCNTVFTSEKLRETATWLQPLAQLLHHSGECEIYNVTLGKTSKVIQSEFDGIEQWILPQKYSSRHGQVLSKEMCHEISNIEEIVKPDVVHIWGTESVWAYVYKKGFISCPHVVIDIQGLLYECARYYYGGLTSLDRLRCIHLKEIIMPRRMLFNKKRIFKRRGELERKNLMAFNNISVQSRWVKDHIHFLNPNANIYDTNILLRDAFYEAKPWTYKKVKDFPIIFSSCSAAASYKGLHILIKALYVLKKKYSNIQLHLAGNMDVGVRLLDGYSIFLHHLIHKYGLESNVIFLGPLDDVQLTDKLQKCNVCVVPSFVESYCLGFAESMIMGVPTVASFAGAMPNIADDGKEALFYNSIDYVTCASKIDELLRSRQLSEYLSANARKRRLVENNKEKVVGNQLSIYKSLLEDDV